MARFQEDYKTLEQALNGTYMVDQLKSLASQISKNNPTRKAELAAHIASTVFKDIDTILAYLDPMAMNALAEAVYNWSGCFKSKPFFAKYSALPQTESKGGRGSMHLMYLFFINGKIPPDLMAILEKKIKRPAPEKIDYEDLDDDPEMTVRETAHAACMNLNALLTMVKENQIRVSPKTGRATAATVKKISAHLCEGDFYDAEDLDPIQAFAWPLLLQGGGLAAIDGNFLKLTRAGTLALKKDLAKGIQTIWKKWEKTKIIDEFSQVTVIKGQRSAKGRTMTSPVRRRPVINGVLTCLEPGRWVSVDEVERFMRSESQTFEMTNYDWKLYFGDPHYGLLDYNDTWSLLQLRYLLIYLFQYGATLGLVDVSYKYPDNARPDFQSCWGADDEPFLSLCDGLMQIRLNDLGAYVLGLSTDYNAVDPRDFEIHDTDILYTGKGIPTPDHSLYLDKIADQTEAGRWQVSLVSLLNALKAGETLKDINAFITQITQEKPGKNLEKLFEKAEERSSAVVDRGKATLLECHGDIRKQILTDKEMGRLCLPAGDRHLVILPEKEALFARYLETLGIIIG
ncbi:conserved hypothetical protein [Desulforapulum autotrophicum HRM2]|uniref:Helicase XPB/Ssl2 N-terminal domain-containing protein n=1 Tax=Desulforapulum autotrophicum (strain ATCC 43914 / DSM 3382 / VKM B-1955 / HRM2) TaxID=177437 RepID=C0QD96_DESAH|nr:hypothetical protein [Desulforapulum autotrophicum]ACN13134.1 conserved hypothetical protein [Desulforapulum autotrophicum HRM2]